ncbi:hypothetical protein DdX_00762 [Ditylenchus destructor]|uniref:Uncharacterized protein n=1 Tax=Ditylenchus destructor TaxID=166010 RepID=A0AAD4R7J7_9BILA|nr:hypothetical protein DdX_00762 [Ditylenchus destructor]
MLTAAAAATACANSPPHPDMTAPCWVDSTTVSPPVKPKCDYESSATMARRTAHRHSHPSSHCTAHNESQYQPRSFSLKCAPIPEHHNRECHDEKCPTSNPIPPQLLCGAVIPENVRSHIGRRRIGSTSALPSGGIQRRHTSGTSASARHIGRRSCGGAVPEDESNMHQLLCQCRSCNSTMFQKQACKCVRCNQLLFLYAFVSLK